MPFVDAEETSLLQAQRGWAGAASYMGRPGPMANLLQPDLLVRWLAPQNFAALLRSRTFCKDDLRRSAGPYWLEL